MRDTRRSRTRLAASPEAGTDAGVTESSVVVASPGSSVIPTPTRSVWTNLSHPFTLGVTVTLGVLVALAAGAAFTNLSTIIIYIVFALFVALGLDPVVRMLERRGVSRTWSIAIVFFGIALIIAAVVGLVLPTLIDQIAQVVKNFPDTVAAFQQSSFYLWLTTQFGDQVPAITKEVEKFLTNPANLAAIGGGVLKVGVSIASGISGLIIVIVLSLYFVATLPQIKQAFYTLVPHRSRSFISGITEEITGSVGGYLQGMVLLAFANSVVAGLLHWILGLPFPLLMAVIAFCITLIPLIGTVLYWGFASILALFSDPTSALIFAIAYLVYMQLEAYILTPRVMNKAISVPGSLVVIGAMVGGTLLGLLGALVAIPVTASILLIIKKVWIPKQDAKV